MPDINLDWKGDFSFTPTGDLATVDGDDVTRQRIIRRLFTATRGYVWHQDYGAGIPERIGKVAKARVIQAIVQAQIALEDTVAKIPVPTITVFANPQLPGEFIITIVYYNNSHQQQTLTFDPSTGSAINTVTS
jgi:hypothetical protein